MNNPLKWKLHWQIAAALLLALIVSTLLRQAPDATGLTETVKDICQFMGTLFMRALKMIVVPLIVSSIICGIMGLGSEKGFRRLGIKTLAYYFASGFVAICIGLAAVNTISPGKVDAQTAQIILQEADNSDHIMEKVAGRGAGDMAEIFMRMVPPNIVEAASSNGQLLGLIFFSLLYGYFVHKIGGKQRKVQERFWQGVQEIMLGITDLILRFAPLGVLGLVTPILIEAQLDQVLGPVLSFFFTVLIALALHMCVALPLAMYFLAKINPLEHFKAMASVILTAFSTASSSSTLPLTMETVEQKAGVSNRTASFTLPLGATVNMDGTALYECVVVIFIAQVYSSMTGVAFGFAEQFTVVVLALATSVGVAGIPAASLVAITVILGVVGLPPEAIGIVWITDRILDMCRTSVNVFSDTCGAVIIARSEGETGVYATPPSNIEQPLA